MNITVCQVLLAWWLYQEGELELRDVRAWLALFEMRERRRFAAAGTTPRYTSRELAKLLGCTVPKARASVRRLVLLGLVQGNRSVLELAASPDQVKCQDLGAFWELLAAVPMNCRALPFPRRLLRFVVGGTTKVETATILAHAVRCLFRAKGGLVRASGNCKASWVEAVFSVSASRVKSARVRLIELGVFEAEEVGHWHRNRYGSRVTFNLAWLGGRPAGTPTEVSPLVLSSSSDLAPSKSVEPPVGGGGVEPQTEPLGAENRPPNGTPIETVPLPTEGRNQTLGGEAPSTTPTGVREQTGKRKPETLEQGGCTVLPNPTLRHVLSLDLGSVERLSRLHEEAVTKGLAPAGERGLLELTSLAEHARRYSTKNPPGLFARLLRDQKWHFITQDDEDLARARLRAAREGEANSQRGSSVRLPNSLPERADFASSGVARASASQGWQTHEHSVSDDALFAARLVRTLAARGIRDEALVLRELQKARPEWTEERWRRARWAMAAGVRVDGAGVGEAAVA